MKILSILVCLITLSLCHSSDIGKSTQEIAIAHNYPCENYTAITLDGYILLLFRIPGHQNESLEDAKKHRRQPIILQHGMLDSSDTFLINESPSLAYLLADKGFDVWLGNFRGNKYSRHHLNLDADENKEYWNFAIDHLIKYDIKTIFSEIIKITGYQKLFYIGHSMGGGSLLAAATRDPSYFAVHVKAFIGLAPATRSMYSNTILKFVYYSRFLETLEVLGIHEIFNDKKFPHDLITKVCQEFPEVRDLFLKWFCDKQPEYNNVKRYVVFLNHFPAGTSNHVMKQLVQQTLNNGYYEYRKSWNNPLVEYDFKKFPQSIPVAILAGKGDILVNIKDTKWLKDELRNAVKLYKEYEGYGHLTFLIPGKSYQAYNDTIAFLTKHY